MTIAEFIERVSTILYDRQRYFWVEDEWYDREDIKTVTREEILEDLFREVSILQARSDELFEREMDDIDRKRQ